MRGLSSLRLSAAVALAPVLVGSPEAAPALFGDLDNDGRPSAGDIVSLVNHLDGSIPLPAELLSFADADRNMVVDAADLMWLVRSALGEVGYFAVNPFVRFEASSSTVEEGDLNGTVMIELNGYVQSGMVEFMVVGGTATEGADFMALMGPAPVRLGRAEIPISVPDDSEREGFETLEIQITGVAGGPGFETILPSRHVVNIQDNDEIWTGTLRLGAGGAYDDFVAFDMAVLRDGPVTSGVLLGTTTSGVPSGEWPMTVMFTGTAFEASVTGVPLDTGAALLPTSVELELSLVASPESFATADPIFLNGLFEETFNATGAPYLSTVQTGTFRLLRVPDAAPMANLEVEDVPVTP